MSRAPTAKASGAGWSARHVLKWVAVCVGFVAGFIASVFLFLMMTVPDMG
jgi:hypothetical protein